MATPSLSYDFNIVTSTYVFKHFSPGAKPIFCASAAVFSVTEKMDIQSIADLAKYAIQEGLTPLEH